MYDSATLRRTSRATVGQPAPTGPTDKSCDVALQIMYRPCHNIPIAYFTSALNRVIHKRVVVQSFVENEWSWFVWACGIFRLRLRAFGCITVWQQYDHAQPHSYTLACARRGRYNVGAWRDPVSGHVHRAGIIIAQSFDTIMIVCDAMGTCSMHPKPNSDTTSSSSSATCWACMIGSDKRACM